MCFSALLRRRPSDGDAPGRAVDVDVHSAAHDQDVHDVHAGKKKAMRRPPPSAFIGFDEHPSLSNSQTAQFSRTNGLERGWSADAASPLSAEPRQRPKIEPHLCGPGVRTARGGGPDGAFDADAALRALERATDSVRYEDLGPEGIILVPVTVSKAPMQASNSPVPAPTSRSMAAPPAAAVQAPPAAVQGAPAAPTTSIDLDEALRALDRSSRPSATDSETAAEANT
jgi:hypothetical protein